jgi:phosphopantetheinyl transferase (holo-ACP synthase)
MPTIAEYKEQIRLKKAFKTNGISALKSFTQPKEIIQEEISKLLPKLLKEAIKLVLSDERFYKIILANIEKPKDGEDADEDLIISEVMKRIKIPKDGRTPTQKELEELIKPLIPEAPKKGVDYFDGLNGSPDTPDQIAEKLNTLKEAVDKSVIKDLEQLFRDVKNLKQGGGQKLFVRGGGGHPNNTYDLSPYLDGVTKTFTIPKNWRVIDVQIGTIPPLRPTVDYTYTANTLTFTDEIDASVYLESGLSAIVIYAE